MPGRRCLHCTQICHLCTCLNWLPMTWGGTVTCSRARSAVARTSLLGSAWWPGLAPRAAGMRGSGGRSHRAGRHAAGFVRAGVIWGVTSRRGGGDVGWRHLGEEFDGLAAGVAGRCRWSRRRRWDPNGGMSAAAGRSGAAGGTSGGGRSGSADPAATIGPAWPGLLVFSFGLIAHGQSRKPQRLFAGPSRV